MADQQPLKLDDIIEDYNLVVHKDLLNTKEEVDRLRITLNFRGYVEVTKGNIPQVYHTTLRTKRGGTRRIGTGIVKEEFATHRANLASYYADKDGDDNTPVTIYKKWKDCLPIIRPYNVKEGGNPYSRYLHSLDFDYKSEQDYNERHAVLKKTLSKSRHTLFYCLSPSGRGLTAWFWTDRPWEHDDSEALFREATSALKVPFEWVDHTTGKGLTGTFMTFDPDAVFKDTAEPIPLPIQASKADTTSESKVSEYSFDGVPTDVTGNLSDYYKNKITNILKDGQPSKNKSEDSRVRRNDALKDLVLDIYSRMREGKLGDVSTYEEACSWITEIITQGVQQYPSGDDGDLIDLPAKKIAYHRNSHKDLTTYTPVVESPASPAIDNSDDTSEGIRDIQKRIAKEISPLLLMLPNHLRTSSLIGGVSDEEHMSERVDYYMKGNLGKYPDETNNPVWQTPEGVWRIIEKSDPDNGEIGSLSAYVKRMTLKDADKYIEDHGKEILANVKVTPIGSADSGKSQLDIIKTRYNKMLSSKFSLANMITMEKRLFRDLRSTSDPKDEKYPRCELYPSPQKDHLLVIAGVGVYSFVRRDYVSKYDVKEDIGNYLCQTKFLAMEPDFDLFRRMKKEEKFAPIRNCYDRFKKVIGKDCMGRIPRLMFHPPNKQVDFFIQRPNYGKTLFAMALRRSFPGLVAYSGNSAVVFNWHKDKHSLVPYTLCTYNLAIYDEADKPKKEVGGELKRRIMSGEDFTGLTSPTQEVDIKFVQKIILNLASSVLFMSNEVPLIQYKAQGVRERIGVVSSFEPENVEEVDRNIWLPSDPILLDSEFYNIVTETNEFAQFLLCSVMEEYSNTLEKLQEEESYINDLDKQMVESDDNQRRITLLMYSNVDEDIPDGDYTPGILSVLELDSSKKVKSENVREVLKRKDIADIGAKKIKSEINSAFKGQVKHQEESRFSDEYGETCKRSAFLGVAFKDERYKKLNFEMTYNEEDTANTQP